jgi:hypothetical protein
LDVVRLVCCLDHALPTPFTVTHRDDLLPSGQKRPGHQSIGGP